METEAIGSSGKDRRFVRNMSYVVKPFECKKCKLMVSSIHLFSGMCDNCHTEKDNDFSIFGVKNRFE